MTLRIISISFAFSIFAMGLTGCASTSLPATAYDRSHYDSVSLATCSEKPEIEIDSRLRGDLGSVTAGSAASTAGGTLLECMQVPYPPLLVFCGLFGAAAGAATSVSTGVPNDADQKSISEIVNKINTAGIQSYLAQEASTYAEKQGVPLVHDSNKSSSISKICLKKVNIYSPGRNTLRGLIHLTFSGQLITGNTVIDEYEYNKTITGWDDIEELNGTRLGAIIEEIDITLKDTTRNYIDEFFLIYYPPDSLLYQQADKDKRFSESVPAYVLRPLQPQVSQIKVLSNFTIDYPDINTLTPIFQWETFPRPWDFPEEDNRYVTDVVYDFRLYSDNHVNVYERSGLKKPSFIIDRELLPCTRYSWSVRAHFKLRSQPRKTEWSGAYNKALLSLPTHPWKLRRDEYSFITNPHSMLGLEHFAYGFKTPAMFPGETCSE